MTSVLQAGPGAAQLGGRACASNADWLPQLTVTQQKVGDKLVVKLQRENQGLSWNMSGNSYAYGPARHPPGQRAGTDEGRFGRCQRDRRAFAQRRRRLGRHQAARHQGPGDGGDRVGRCRARRRRCAEPAVGGFGRLQRPQPARQCHGRHDRLGRPDPGWRRRQCRHQDGWLG